MEEGEEARGAARVHHYAFPCSFLVVLLALTSSLSSSSSLPAPAAHAFLSSRPLPRSLRSGARYEGGGRTALRSSVHGEEDAARLKEKYYRDRELREMELLAASNVSALYAEPDTGPPAYITRWGGADLAQEGPTRKVLELMSDSEWFNEWKET
uniref:Uncharacterized protein n=1 Tax=Guillardia theta TaxID=55529 RepID=A0A7S4KQZ8_GUITH